MSLIAELKRRNVFRVGLFYVVAAWLVIEVAETVLPLFDVPEGVLRGATLVVAALAIGVFAYDRMVPASAPMPTPATTLTPVDSHAGTPVQDASIAVLPFTDLSPAGDQEYIPPNRSVN